MREPSPRAFRSLLWLLAIEALPALLLLFRVPSESADAVLFGYALPRLLLGAGFGVLTLGLIVLAGIVSAEIGPGQRVWRAWRLCLSSRTHSQRLILTLFYAELCAGMFTVLLLSPAARHFGPLEYAADRSISILIWFNLALIQTFTLVLVQTHPFWREPDFLRSVSTLRYGSFALLGALTILHWIMMLFRLPWFTDLPLWWMRYVPKTLNARDLLILPALLAAILLLRSCMYEAHRPRNLILLIAFGYLLQVGLGFIDGGGFESLRVKLVESNHNRYALNAVPNLSVVNAITEYETRHGEDPILCTKPPGGLVVYILMEKTANLGTGVENHRLRYNNLTAFAAAVFPLFATMTVIPLHGVSRRLLPRGSAHIPALLFLVTPSVLIIQLQLDQFLYPLLFISGTWITIIALQDENRAAAFTAGLFAYVTLFISFSLLPLLAMQGGLYAFGLLRLGGSRARRGWFRASLLTLGGFMLTHLTFLWAFDYNMLSRFGAAMDCHRGLKLFQPGVGQVSDAFILNNLEYLLWTGVALVGLGVLRIGRSVWHAAQRRLNPLDGLALAFGAMLIGLNLFGQTRGEVGRIWIFLTPIFTLLAVDELSEQQAGNARAFTLLLVVQLLTSYGVFKFMDFF
jgi:hypothetical protein